MRHTLASPEGADHLSPGQRLGTQECIACRCMPIHLARWFTRASCACVICASGMCGMRLRASRFASGHGLQSCRATVLVPLLPIALPHPREPSDPEERARQCDMTALSGGSPTTSSGIPGRRNRVLSSAFAARLPFEAQGKKTCPDKELAA